MPNTLNDIFAHLDNAKASRAYETNQERRRKVEEAEHERKVKQAAESAVEKYHVYDDDYDVEDVEEPLVMIPKQNPGTPEAKAATMPASKKDMDDIADNNPFVQNLFKRSHKQVRQERPAREKLAASTNTAKAPQTLAAPASEPTAPQSETFNVPVTPVPVQPVAPSAPASTVAPAVPETVDTVDFVDDIPLTSSLTIPRQTSRTSSPTERSERSRSHAACGLSECRSSSCFKRTNRSARECTCSGTHCFCCASGCESRYQRERT